MGLNKTAAKEYGPVEIRIKAVCPAFIWTPMNAANAVVMGKDVLDKAVEAMPMPRFGEADEVERVIAFLLSEESNFVTGAASSVDREWST